MLLQKHLIKLSRVSYISESAGAGLSIYEMGSDVKAINEFNNVGDELLELLGEKV